MPDEKQKKEIIKKHTEELMKTGYFEDEEYLKNTVEIIYNSIVAFIELKQRKDK